jgi:hypothetical protein
MHTTRHNNKTNHHKYAPVQHGVVQRPAAARRAACAPRRFEAHRLDLKVARHLGAALAAALGEAVAVELGQLRARDAAAQVQAAACGF